MEPEYPRGKLNPLDEGSTKVAVTVGGGTLIIRFQKPMLWLGLGYDEAKLLGELLPRRAEEIRQ